MGDIVAVARLLAEDDDLAAGDLPGFHPRALAAARAFEGLVSVRDARSRPLLNTAIPQGAPLPVRTSLAEEDAAAAARGAPAVSNLYIGLADARPWVAVVLLLPARDGAGEDAPRFLSLAVEARRVQRALEEGVILGPGQVAGIMDRAGTVIARSRAPEAAVGRRSFMRVPDDPPAGSAPGRNRDGEEVTLHWRTSALTGWRVTVTTPDAALAAPARAALVQIAASGLVALLGSLLAAILVGRRIAGAVGALQAAAAAFRGDAPAVPPATGLRETDAVGAALAASARDLRETEDRQRLLIAELNHRVKNTLASVQSLAAQTLRPGVAPEEGARALQSRLLALAAAHDVLTRENWEDAPLRAVLAGALRPFAAEGDDRLALDGPAVRVPPRVALALALAMHELATNAAKYGALSAPGGRVALRWSAGSGRLALDWVETGGPPVTPPAARGFGSRLLERGLAHELGGTVSLTFPPEGARCRIEAPLRR